jgi:phospholipid N-methyltransferase
MIDRLKNLLPSEKRKSLSRKFHRLKFLGFDYYPGEDVESLREKINLYFKIFPSKRKEFEKELEFLNSKARKDFKFSYILPYEFVFEHDMRKVKVHKDPASGLFYVMHNEKKLFYSRHYTTESSVQFTYNCICIEQDERSPHRYLSDGFDVNEGDTVLDIGAAEGNFTLDVIERAGDVYIFETDEMWIEALELTFEPWKDKVHIINKFVSNVDNNSCVTLEKMFRNSKIDFIKMDVEGAEIEILECSKKILDRSSDLKLAVCTYHAGRDRNMIEKILNNSNYECKTTDGNMLFIYSILTPPYFRKVLLRAVKPVR